MKKIYRAIRYWIPVVFVLSLIFFLSSLRGDQVPKVGLLDFKNADKLEHFLIYSLLGFMVSRALTADKRNNASLSNYKSAILASILFGLLYALSDEFHQYFVPGRGVEWGDVIADTLGATFGALVMLKYRKWVSGWTHKTDSY